MKRTSRWAVVGLWLATGCAGAANDGAAATGDSVESSGGEAGAGSGSWPTPLSVPDAAPVGYGTVGQTKARQDAAAEEAAEAAAKRRAMRPRTAPPDGAGLNVLLERVVVYPATRAAVLGACAKDEACSASNLPWLSNHLPEAEYRAAVDVKAALGY